MGFILLWLSLESSLQSGANEGRRGESKRELQFPQLSHWGTFMQKKADSLRRVERLLPNPGGSEGFRGSDFHQCPCLTICQAFDWWLNCVTLTVKPWPLPQSVSALKLYDLRDSFKDSIKTLKFYLISESSIHCLQFLLFKLCKTFTCPKFKTNKLQSQNSSILIPFTLFPHPLSSYVFIYVFIGLFSYCFILKI